MKLKIKDLVADGSKYHIEVEITDKEVATIMDYLRYFDGSLFIEGKIVDSNGSIIID